MKPMRFRLSTNTETYELEASCWTDLMDKLRVLQLSFLVKIERLS